MDYFSGSSILELAELLQPADDAKNDSDEDQPKPGVARMGPGDIGGRKSETTGQDSSKTSKQTDSDTKEIWTDKEVSAGAEYDDVDDPRVQPEYDMLYKQAVTSEDMFLQLGNKTPSTASCEDLIIKVKLPSTKFADITLDVTTSYFDCRTSMYKLGLFLPHKVDSKQTKAQWDADKEMLIVTLRLDREYDQMNF